MNSLFDLKFRKSSNTNLIIFPPNGIESNPIKIQIKIIAFLEFLLKKALDFLLDNVGILHQSTIFHNTLQPIRSSFPIIDRMKKLGVIISPWVIWFLIFLVGDIQTSSTYKPQLFPKFLSTINLWGWRPKSQFFISKEAILSTSWLQWSSKQQQKFFIPSTNLFFKGLQFFL